MKKRRILVTKIDPEFLLVLPKETLEEIEALAKSRGRSVNTQFVMMITEQLSALEEKRKSKENMDSNDLMNMIFCTKAKEFKVRLRGK